MKDHQPKKLTKTEQMIVALQQQINMINVGCLSEIRGLMIALKVDPKLFVESVNDEVAMQVLGRNLHSHTEAYKFHKAKEEAKVKFTPPTLQTND